MVIMKQCELHANMHIVAIVDIIGAVELTGELQGEDDLLSNGIRARHII